MSSNRLRIALTTGPVAIPPTYFVVQHALALGDRHTFALFAPRAEVEPDIDLEVHSALPRRTGPRSDSLRLHAAQRRVARSIRRWRPDLVHQHFATWSIPAARVSASLGVPMITTLHGYDVFAMTQQSSGIWGTITRRNLAATSARTTRFLAVSRWLAARAIEAGIEASRVDVLYQGVDTSWFTPAGRTPTADEPPTVLFAGGLVEHKGVRELITASIALSETVEHTLEVVGAGPLEQEVRAAAAEHPHIRVGGFSSRDELRERYRRARVAVVPSLSLPRWSEAAGLVALEAQACGTPIVATRSGGLPEMLLAGETGSLVDPGDSPALASAIGEWLLMPEPEHRRHREAAAAFVARERDATRSAQRLAEIYSEVASR